MSRPTDRATSLRPLGMPRPVEVALDADGMPATVTRRRRGARPAAVRVVSVEEVWRVAEAWWREAPQSRTYYRLVLEDGRALTLFHDEERDAWAEQPYGTHEAHETHEVHGTGGGA